MLCVNWNCSSLMPLVIFSLPWVHDRHSSPILTLRRTFCWLIHTSWKSWAWFSFFHNYELHTFLTWDHTVLCPSCSLALAWTSYQNYFMVNSQIHSSIIYLCLGYIVLPIPACFFRVLVRVWVFLRFASMAICCGLHLLSVVKVVARYR